MQSLTLLTDLYELTMAYGYWKSGMTDKEACFHHVFRRCPFGGAFAVACGLSRAIEFLESFRFHEEELVYLEGLVGADGERLFEAGFLDHLQAIHLACDVDAVPEGTVVFPQEPLVRVCGPLLQAQILETALLNVVNYQTLIATKAARVRLAAKDGTVLEFGLRRAQGFDGGISASRAAFVGGCDATSNVLAGRLFDIPVRGTHAHSWIMAFDDEQSSFDAYGRAMPNNCVLLVDTYDTHHGVEHAIETGRRLRAQGHELLGIRLDSGDLLKLSRRARRQLDEAGFQRTRIVASGDLDEHEIARLEAGGAPIDVWGVGTRLATAYDEPALGGVYKLAALRDSGSPWRHKVKRSDDPAKSSSPGVQQVRRIDFDKGDVIYDIGLGIDAPGEDLLVPVFRRGRSVYRAPAAKDARARALEQVGALPAAVRRLTDPEPFPVRLEPRLSALKDKLMEEVAR